MKKSRVFAALVTAALLLPISACDNAGEENEPPALIPAAAFQMDTQVFNTKSAGPNFAAAALRVWPVSLAVTAHMIIPAAVTLAAANEEPVFEDGAWHWTTSTQSGVYSIDLELIATPVSPGHDWSMLVSYNDGTQVLDDFELYSGHTENNGTEGNWSLNYMLNGIQTNVLNAMFNSDSVTDRQLELSIPATAPAHAGASVEYVVDGTARAFTLNAVNPAGTHVIEWDAETNVGSITAPNYNGGVTACWDANLDDAACE